MHKNYCIFIVILLIITVFSVGCVDNTPVASASPTLSPTLDVSKIGQKTVNPTAITTTVKSSSTPKTTSSIQSGSSSGVQIRITYSGTWSGSYYNDGSLLSVDGTGSKTITLDNPNSIVSTSFQKKDGSQDELKVEILKNGDVLKSGSTTTAYGVVAVASTTYGTSSSSIGSTSSKSVQIKVNYNGKWSGAYGEVGAIQSIDGTGSKTYTITNPNYAVSASFQKQDSSTSTLNVEIIEDGKVIKSGSTTAAYGIVAISATI